MANPPGQGGPGLVPPTQDQGQQQVQTSHQMGGSQGMQQGNFGAYPPTHGVNGGKRPAGSGGGPRTCFAAPQSCSLVSQVIIRHLPKRQHPQVRAKAVSTTVDPQDLPLRIKHHLALILTLVRHRNSGDHHPRHLNIKVMEA